MAIAVNENHLVAASWRLPLRQIPALVELHLANVAGTQALETTGFELRRASFLLENLGDFIREVCRWGGYAGIAGRVLAANSHETIRHRFQEAVAALEAPAADAPDRNVAALHALNQIRGFGRPSFATKQLRFLEPRFCPVLDSRVTAAFHYTTNHDGYRHYSADCLRVARTLSERAIPNPMKRADGQWFAADVDMAVFALIAKWSPHRAA